MSGVFADPGAHTAIYTGSKTVTTAGTQVPLTSTSTGIHTVVVKAKSANTGVIYIGNSDVDSSSGLPLAAGEALTITINNLNKVYIDASVNGEGVNYFAT